MRFVRFGGGRTGIVIEAGGLQVVDVVRSLAGLHGADPGAAALLGELLPDMPGQSWREMIGRWDEARPAFAALQALPPDRLVLHPFAGTKLEPPLAAPDCHIFAMGSNTTDHIIRAFKVMQNLDLTEAQARKSKEDGLPPFGFMLWPATVAGPDDSVAPPRGTLKFDYEGECAVYVRTGGRDLRSVKIWGYTAFNDLGVRDPFLGLVKDAPWGPFSLNLPKNFDTSNSCGPWVAVDEAGDLSRLRCVVTVNGQTRQDWRLDQMIYNFDETLGYISRSLTLRPGDMLCSGTGAGVALEGGVDGPDWLKPGDVIEVRLDGVAPLRNTVAPW